LLAFPFFFFATALPPPRADPRRRYGSSALVLPVFPFTRIRFPLNGFILRPFLTMLLLSIFAWQLVPGTPVLPPHLRPILFLAFPILWPSKSFFDCPHPPGMHQIMACFFPVVFMATFRIHTCSLKLVASAGFLMQFPPVGLPPSQKV